MLSKLNIKPKLIVKLYKHQRNTASLELNGMSN